MPEGDCAFRMTADGTDLTDGISKVSSFHYITYRFSCGIVSICACLFCVVMHVCFLVCFCVCTC